jgi:hypothetical protein
MRHRFFAFAFAGFIVALISPALVRAEESRRDGNWWREQSAPTKAFYMTGFFDGMDLGAKFAAWGLMTKKDETSTTLGPIPSKVYTSYADYLEKYLKHVTNIQISDGLDAFYNDYRNRTITLDSAVWLVLNTIAGTPAKDLEKMIDNFRKFATSH